MAYDHEQEEQTFVNAITQYQNVLSSKYLAGVDDQISEAASGREELPDDNSYKAQADIYFHVADDCRQGMRQYHFYECLQPCSLQRIYQFDFSGIYRHKAAVQA